MGRGEGRLILDERVGVGMVGTEMMEGGARERGREILNT